MHINTDIDLPEVLEIYIKFLYSQSFAKKILSEKNHPLIEKIIKSSTNQERLQAEHYARYKNFCSHIQMSLTLVNNFITSELVDALSKNYCDSDSFWSFEGRSLTENFCLYSYRYLMQQAEPFLAECMKFQGVVAGLKHQPLASSPWGNKIAEVDGCFTESYRSPYTMTNIKENVNSYNGFTMTKPAFEITVSISPGNDGVKIYERAIKS